MNRHLFNGPRIAATQCRSERIPVVELRRESLNFTGAQDSNMNGIEYVVRCRLCESPIKSGGKPDQFCCEGCRELFEKIRSGYVIDVSSERLDLRSLASGDDKRDHEP